jgi:glucosamine-6-phosphate deaminase
VTNGVADLVVFRGPQDNAGQSSRSVGHEHAKVRSEARFEHSRRMNRFRAGQAEVIVADTPDEAGAIAAADFANVLREVATTVGWVSVILATGNSQVGFLASLVRLPGLPWDRTIVFHMDEYVGISADHPASFRRYMRERLVNIVQPAAFHAIAGDAPDLAAEMRRYADLLRKSPPSACVLGIGENGHLAFNDPPADFEANEPIQIVTLAAASRRQQVGEGHFAKLADVPRTAITLTIPTLLAPPNVLAVVPEQRKAQAVRFALASPLSAQHPASILTQKAGVTVYLDPGSASLLNGK